MDRPVIHYVVEEAIKSGLDEILIVVGYGKDSIINYFDRHKLDREMDLYGIYDLPDIYFVRQKEQLGLANAISYGEHFTDDEDFAVLLGDTIYRSGSEGTVTSQMVDSFNKIGESIIALENVPLKDVVNYGIVDGKEISENFYKIERVVEKPSVEETPSNMGITGIYIFKKEIYKYLRNVKPGKNGEMQLSDAINAMAKEYEIYGQIINGERYDIGNMELWIKTFLKFARERGY